LPVRNNAFVKHPQPVYPVDGLSFEAYDPDLNRPIDRVFVAGWSREASSGLVGVARKDGENGSRAVMDYLLNQPALVDPKGTFDEFVVKLGKLSQPIVHKSDVRRLVDIQRTEAERLGLPDFKYATNDEMLVAMGIETTILE
jgi:ferredoxin/flavodoxin---NADP+ reductase